MPGGQYFVAGKGGGGLFIAPEKTPVPQWISIFDNTNWQINPAEPYGNWNGTDWDMTIHVDQPGGDYELNLIDIGGWATGFRPTKMRINGQSGFGYRLYLFDTADNAIIPSTFLNPTTTEMACDFSNNLDIDNLLIRFINLAADRITSIEFFGIL